MSRYTYQHLETIRERAVKRGLKAEIASRTSDDEPYLVIELGPDRSVRLAYHMDFGRLSSFSIWGPTAAKAIELDVLHQLLTDGLVEPVEPVEPEADRDCGSCVMGRLPAGCELIGCSVRAAETIESAP